MASNTSIDKYLDSLAGRSPAPGGGSAAALVGAAGTSLLAMAAKYAMTKAAGAARAKVSKIALSADRGRRRLRKLMIEDEKAYLRLSGALKKKDSKNLTRLYRDAAEVPLEVCLILQDGLNKCGKLTPYCRGAIASDLKEAALLMKAGFLSAGLNVNANLRGIKDKMYVRNVSKRIRTMVTKWR